MLELPPLPDAQACKRRAQILRRATKWCAASISSSPPGECFGLLGPNGAGKTTTLRLALGLTDPDAGEITLLGEPIPRRAREARVRLGVVPQVDNLDPDFTVVENLLVYGRYFGLRDQDVRARIPQLLEFAGLESRAGSRIQALSGGMKRRLALARALVNDPDLLLLDEPTTGLDPQARHLIWERLKQLRRARQDRPSHHPFHGRGRAPVRPA